MSAIPDPLIDATLPIIAAADPGRLAHVDRVSALWRDYFRNRGLDLSDPVVADSSITAMTMVYGLLLNAHQLGEIDQLGWESVQSIMVSSAAAAVTARDGAHPTV